MNRKDKFWTYLNDGNVKMHNNAAERLAKSFAAIRKNFLFCKTNDSAKKSAILMTLVKSAEANNIYPDSYLEFCLKGISEHRNVEELMPWSSELEEFKMKD